MIIYIYILSPFSVITVDRFVDHMSVDHIVVDYLRVDHISVTNEILPRKFVQSGHTGHRRRCLARFRNPRRRSRYQIFTTGAAALSALTTPGLNFTNKFTRVNH